MRLFTLLLMTVFLALAGCSKSKPTAAPEAPENAVQNDACPQLQSVLKSVNTKESERNELEKAAKTSPAKENFKRLYDAEVRLSQDVNDAIAKLTECGVKLPESTLGDLQKKIAQAQKDITYLGDNFPEFKKP